MCGIVGVLDRSGEGLPEELIHRMVADLAHRGPDGQGVTRRGPLAIGHRRLSILDPAGGRQPMSNEDGEVWVTFNGEIYNYKEIANDLVSRGHVFRTHCDTEVIVHAWEEWGRSCVDRFRGMFAFAVADWRRGALFLARDHFGIKPLEWIATEKAFAFASEIAPLRRTPGFRPDLDLRAIDEYLWFQYIPAPRTGYEQIRKLAPGHSMVVGMDGRLEDPKPYWEFHFDPETGRTAEEWVERVDEAIEESVSAHLISDVPFGAFLSGGVDSSLVVAKMSRLLERPVETFSIGHPDPDFDETAYARIASDATGSNHHVEIVDADALAILPDLVRHYGEPFADSSAIPTWHVSRLARRHVPMVLSGDGADEFFAGYWSHGDWMDGAGGKPGPHRLEDWIGHIQYIDSRFREGLWRQEFRHVTPSLPEVFRDEWERSKGRTPLHRVQHMDVKTYLPSAILKKVDIASMMHGLEVRTPFVDVRIAELAARIPSDHAMVRNSDSTWNRKALLKEVAARHFPRSFLGRPKMGFAVPVVKWFRPGTPLWFQIRERLLGGSSPLAALFDQRAVAQTLEARHAANIWQLLFLDEWLRQIGETPIAVETPLPKVAEPICTERRRPRVLVIADVPRWIFERHAKTLQRELVDEFDVEIGYQGEAVEEDRFDLIYPLEWNLVPPDRIRTPRKWITGIRSHISWKDRDPGEFGWILREKFQRVHAVSRKLCDEIRRFRPDVFPLTHGVDLSHFKPEGQPFGEPGRIRIGWAGNRRSPAKGFEEFIAPLAAIPGVELRFCGYSDRLVDMDEMRGFYEGIDVYVCSSSTEGNNNSLLEAAAMGRAIVTTDVGTVSEYLVDGRSALIVPRTADAFRAAIIRLLEDPELGRSLGRAAREAVKVFSWESKLQEHRLFLRSALASIEERKGAKNEPLPGRAAATTVRVATRIGGGSGTKDDERFAEAMGRANQRFEAGDMPGALDVLRDADIGSERLEAINARAWILVQMGRVAQAQAEYARAVQLWPELPSVHSNLAGLLIMRGMGDKARTHLLKVLELSPGDADAKLALERIDGASEVWMPSFSFCLITNGERLRKLTRTIRTIRAQGKCVGEIMVAGILPPGFSEPGIEFLSMPDAARNGRLGEMRNAMVERAIGDVLVVCDDDFVFDGDFCQKLAERGPGFDVLCARIRNPDGSRFWDWASAGAKGQRLLPYGESDPDVYVTGGLCIARPHVFSRCRWNADLGFYQSEDLDFSRRLKAEGIRIESCPSAQVMHDDHRYSQFDAHVVRVDMVRKSVGELVADHPAKDARVDLAKRLVRFVADLQAGRPSRLEELAGLADEVGFDELAVAIRARIESLADAGAAFAVFQGADEADPISKHFKLLLPFLDGHTILLTGMNRPAIPTSDPIVGRIMARPARGTRVLATLASPDDWKSVLAAAKRKNAGCREIAFLCAEGAPVAFPASLDGVATRWIVPGERRWERRVDQVLADPRALDEQAESLASVLFEPRKPAPDELDGRIQWAAPLLNYSGYARLNRDLVRCLHDAGIDPGVAPLDTDPGFLASIGDDSAEGTFWRTTLERPRGEGVLVCSHLPSSFPAIRRGCGHHRRHVGLTMFETDRLPSGWADACNEMDEIWVPSTFNFETFSSAGVDRHRLKVIPCGIDLDRWDPATPPMAIPGARSFVFLAVFEWTLRKGWDVLVEAFARAFGPDDDVCLVLRARRPGNDSMPIRAQIERHLRSRGCDPQKTAPIILLEDPLPDSSMPSLYARADVVVLPTRGEGWGLPFMEALAMERPVVATEWGAHLDFVDDSVGWLVPIEGLETVPRQQSDLFPLYEPGHRWARPSMHALVDIMGRIPSSRDAIREKGIAGRLRLAKEWSPERSAAWVRSRLEALSGGTEMGADGASPCREPGVLVKAGFFDFSGYSRLARDAALSLREQGARIGVQAFLQERRFLEGLADSPERLDVYRELVRDDGSKDVAIAWFPPTVWHGKHVYERFREEHPDCRKFVAMTMFETDRLPEEWARRCNEMDEIWVPTSFNAETFARAGVDRQRLRVVPFGLRMDEYDPERIIPMDLGASDDYVFLSVFQWSWRKGWDLLLEAFAREFSPDEKVKLVLRTYPLGDPEPPIRNRIDAFLAAKGLGAMSRRVQLVEEFVSDDRMPSLINACDCFVLPTRGEGWGIPFMEAMALSKPVIATRWSGHLDFMDDANSFLVDIEGLEPVQEQMRQDSELYEPDHRWARPSLDHLRRRMREVFSDPGRAKEVGRVARESVLTTRDASRTARWIRERCRELSNVAVKRAPDVVAVDARCLFDADTRDRGIGHYTNEHLLALERNDPGLRFLFLAPEGADPRLVGEHLACGRVEVVPFSRFHPGSVDHFHIPDPLGDCEGRISPFHVGFRGPRSTVFYDLIPRKLYLEHWSEEMRSAYLRRLEEAVRFEGVHLCISRSTRSDLVAEGFDANRALWIGAGLNRASSTSPIGASEADELLARLGIRGQFFLQVGALDAHKNFQGSLSCFLAAREKVPCQLVVVGRRTHSIAWWEQYCRSRGIPDVVFADFLPRRDLEILYARATALLFLSRMEGFGFPVLEAMAQGCPAIAYANSSLPEVGGDAACLVQDGDEVAVVKTMLRLLGDPEEHARRRRAGIERAASFSWDDVACRTLDAWGRTADVRGDRRTKAVERSNPAESNSRGMEEGTPARVAWAAPVFDPSGYGDEARGFLRCLDAQGETIAVRSIGRASERFRDGMVEQDRALFDKLSARPALAGATLVVSFPAHGYKRFAEYGYHAGRTMFETDSLPPSWVDACDSMDEIWVPTDFNLETFRRAGVRRPILKIPGGVDAKTFRPGLVPLALPGPSRGTTYLSVFEWTRRKAPDVLLAGWARAFTRDDDVRLVLRAYPPNGIEGDPVSWVESRIAEELARIGRKREDCAPIVVLAAQIPDRDMPRLYAAADVYLAPSRGEGWGRPHMEAMSCGVPVIATRWSGNLEFQNDDNSWLIDVEGVVPVEGMEFDFYQGMRWAEPSLDSFVSLLCTSRVDVVERTRKGERAREDVETRWDWTISSRLVATRLAEIRRGVPATESVLGGRASRADVESAKPTLAGVSGSSRLSGVLGKVARGLRMRGAGMTHAASPVPKADAAAPAGGVPSLSIRWEGSQFVHHSLAHVNRELCVGLAKRGHDLSIIPFEPDQFGPGEDPDLRIIEQLTNAPLEGTCQIHVRHQWPPNLVPPKEGRWVVAQPWEFGSPPKAWMRAFRDQVDELWAYTKYVRDMYVRAGVPEDRVHVLPLGVDCDKFRPGLAPLASLPPKKGVRFLYVGGSIARKGFDVLLNAWQKAFGPDDPVELLIKDMGGKTSYKGQTGERFVRQIQESGRFAPIHYVDDDLAPSDLPALYASGDVLVHPYRGEGFGLPIAEAMACGLPVVITAGGAADDFCGPEEGWMIPAERVLLPGGKVDDMETVEPAWWLEPSEEALIAALRAAASDSVTRSEKGNAARRRIAEHFTWEQAVERAQERLRAVAQRPIRRSMEADGRFLGSLASLNRRASEDRPGGIGSQDELEGLSQQLFQVEALVSRQELEEAEILTRKVVDGYPGQPMAWVSRAMVLRGLKKGGKALEALEKALDVGGGPEVRYEMLALHLQQGKEGAARVQWNILREKHPSWVEAQRKAHREQELPWLPDRFKSPSKGKGAKAKKK